MTSLQSTALSEKIPAHLHLQIISAASAPATADLYQTETSVEIPESFAFFRFHFDEQFPFPHADHFFGGKASGVILESTIHPEELAMWQRLAAGEQLLTQQPKKYNQKGDMGTLTLYWIVGFGGNPLNYSPTALLDFVPAEPMPKDVPFHDWRYARFPLLECGDLGPEGEAIQLFLYRRWVEETSPSRSSREHYYLLYNAVVDNLEHLVAGILEESGQVNEGSPAEIEESLLGIAMENHGELPQRVGYMEGCHRNYRQDDFCEAEDRETWLPRAQRIIDMLKAAGARDFSRLLPASRNGDVQGVRRMLAEGFPPNFAIYGYSTALCEAGYGGHIEICSLLLEAGANPNLPFPFRAEMCYGGMVYPLEAGIEHPEIVRLLLDAGADATACSDDDDSTPIVFRSKITDAQVADLIFSRVGFDSLRSSSKKTGVHILSPQQLDFFKRFIPASLLDEADAMGATPLLRAIQLRDAEKARWLINAGASLDRTGFCFPSWDCNFIDSKSMKFLPVFCTPLQAALLLDNYQIMNALLEYGAGTAQTVLQFSLEEEFAGAQLEAFRRELQAAEDALHLPPLEVGYSKFSIGSVYSGRGTFTLEWARFVRLLSLEPSLGAQFHAFTKVVDVLDFAQQVQCPPECVATYQAGRPLGAWELLRLAEEKIVHANEAANQFEAQLLSGVEPDACSMLSSIDCVALFLDLVREKICGEVPAKRTLSADIQAAASQEFDGGAARARRDAERSGEVEFDDFMDALRENLAPGSTMDFGKLLQAARRTLKELVGESATLLQKL